MNKTAFYGSIWTDDYDVYTSILQDWLETKKFDKKIRLTGEEIVYESEDLYLFSYNTVEHTGVKPSYLLEGNTSASLDETRDLLQSLADLCQKSHITTDLEYVAVNEDGDEISEQFTL